MPTLRINDVELYYELHGDGPNLVNISGSGNDLRTSAPKRNPLNKHFTVCHYDQRGLGRATDDRDADGVANPELAYTMADYADDAAAMMDHLGWDRANVVGTSFGGMVAQNLAVLHPERVERLVLACTSAGGAGEPSADLLALSKLPDAEALITRGDLLDTRNDLANGVLAPGMDVIVEWSQNRADEVPEPDDVAQAGARRQLEARAGHNMWEPLAAIGHNTLVIGGTYDGIAPPANLERLASQIPNAQLHFCDGGHIFMLQDKTAWPTIIDFLQAPV